MECSLERLQEQLSTKVWACAAACDSHHNPMEADEVVVETVYAVYEKAEVEGFEGTAGASK